jgi:formylglycine-generating enzyme required for sulfatase activity
MRRSAIIYILLVTLFLSIMFIFGCEEDKSTEPELVFENDSIDVVLIDNWDLYEFHYIDTTNTGGGHAVRKVTKPVLMNRDAVGYPVFLVEEYLIIERTSILLDGDLYSSTLETIDRVCMNENQLWTVDEDGIYSYHYDYYYNDESGALWMKEDIADTLAFDPIAIDTLGCDLSEFLLFYRSNSGPMVILNKPENDILIPNEDITNLRPKFTWLDYPGAEEYQLQVARDTLFVEGVDLEFEEFINDNQHQVQTDMENFVTFYWRVKADNSYWSEVWHFGTFYVVELNSPTDNSYIHLKPTISWDDYDGASEYTLQISQDIYFEDDVITVTTTNTDYIHNENFEADTEYFWHVKTDNSQGNWSDIWSFTTEKGVILSDPADEETEVAIPVTFEWSALDNAANYTILVSEDSLFGTTIVNEIITVNEYTDTGVLEINKEYYWTVNSDVSAVWSDTISFKTNISPLLVSPENEVVGVITQFTWEVYTGAQNYVIQVDENSNFNDPTVDSYIYYDGGDITCATASRIRENDDDTIDFIPLMVEDLEGGTQYFWRVQRDSLEWSEIWSFTTNDPSGQVTLTTPVNADSTIVQLQRFDWASFSGTTFYRFELCHEETFTDTMWSNIVTEDNYYTLNEDENEMLLVGETYYWRVRSDMSGWSDVWSFTVRDGIPFDIELTNLEETPHKIDMIWVMSSGEHTAIYIERSIDDTTSWEEIASLAGDAEDYADLGLEENTIYYYRFRSENPLGFSGYSEPIIDTTKTFSFDNPPVLMSVNSGTFMMGSNEGDDDEQPVHEVTLTNSFQLGKYEITNVEFCEILNWALGKGKIKGIYGSAYNYTADAIKIDDVIREDDACKISYNNFENIFKIETGMENYPVNDVLWFGAVNYANWLSQIDGLTSLYTSGASNVSCDVYGAEGYRLPTEAEWEFSARGGNDSGNFTYSGSNNVDDVAWYIQNVPDPEPQPVGGKAANELNTFDMSGNLWEWCNDKYDAEYYSSSPGTNPTGPTGNISGITKVVVRGGSWEDDEDFLRNANRSNCKANLVYRVNTSIGFRIVKISP